MNTTFIPGPWEATKAGVYSGPLCVAKRHPQQRDHKQWAADARLIAAAPLLFEACNMLLSECTTDEARRYMTRKYGEAHWREAVRAGYTALSAARGE